MDLHRILLRAALVCAGLFTSATHAAVISAGTPITDSANLPGYLTDGSYLFGATVTLGADQFLLPVAIAGATDLQNWQFDLFFDNSVVEEVDPGDGTAGLYGAQFTPGDPNSLSLILGGFALNSQGLVDDVAGSYPNLPIGASGDGVLAYVLFHRLQAGDPGFGVDGPPVVPIAEPGTLTLFVGVLATSLLFTRRREAPQLSSSMKFGFDQFARRAS